MSIGQGYSRVVKGIPINPPEARRMGVGDHGSSVQWNEQAPTVGALERCRRGGLPNLLLMQVRPLSLSRILVLVNNIARTSELCSRNIVLTSFASRNPSEEKRES